MSKPPLPSCTAAFGTETRQSTVSHLLYNPCSAPMHKSKADLSIAFTSFGLVPCIFKQEI